MDRERKAAIVSVTRIEGLILHLRGRRVMLDADLAWLYGVATKRLNEQVRRNRARFPSDFLFRLTREEKAEVVASCDHLRRLKFSPTLPQAFTEHGAVMLANVLRSRRAVRVSLQVVRAFVRLRHLASASEELARRLGELERRVLRHDSRLRFIFEAIRELMGPPGEEGGRGRIGFRPPSRKDGGGRGAKTAAFPRARPAIRRGEADRKSLSERTPTRRDGRRDQASSGCAE